MKHRIDPMIDCVAKAILGDADHTDRTVDFLQAVLQCHPPIVEVIIENPFSMREFLSDPQTVVDVRARDAAGHQFVVEIQIHVPPFLPERMVYGWSDTYTHRLQSGEGYHRLQPVVSIWLLGRTLFRNTSQWHHRFQLLDAASGLQLTSHLAIHVLELPKWQHPVGRALDAMDRWMYFFREAGGWEVLPDEVDDPTMRQAMTVLKRFAEKEEDYRLYQSRQDFVRARLAEEYLLAEALAGLEREQAAREREQAARESAEAKLARLLAQMKEAGLTPQE